MIQIGFGITHEIPVVLSTVDGVSEGAWHLEKNAAVSGPGFQQYTDTSGLSESLLASAHPADPAPTMM